MRCWKKILRDRVECTVSRQRVSEYVAFCQASSAISFASFWKLCLRPLRAVDWYLELWAWIFPNYLLIASCFLTPFYEGLLICWSTAPGFSCFWIPFAIRIDCFKVGRGNVDGYGWGISAVRLFWGHWLNREPDGIPFAEDGPTLLEGEQVHCKVISRYWGEGCLGILSHQLPTWS